MTRLEQENPHLQSDLTAGQELLQQNYAPQFLQTTVSTLEERWRDTTALASERYNSLQVVLASWEEYNTCKAKVLDVLKRAGAEAAHSPSPGGQEAIQREITTKQVQAL